MHILFRYLPSLAVCCALLSCNNTASCTRRSGCAMVVVKQRSNDSLVLDTTRCSYSLNGRPFQDSLRLITAPYADESRYATVITDSIAAQSDLSVKGKDVADAEARGYTCQLPK